MPRPAVVAALVAMALTGIQAGAAPSRAHDRSPYRCFRCLFEIRTDGTGFRSLPVDGNWAIRDLSPDRTQILLEQRSRLSVANLDGTGVRLLSGDVPGGSHARFSPDGRMVAFDRNESKVGGRCAHSSVWVVRIDGSGLERVSADCALNPVWAPDSRRIAFVRHWGINYQSGIVTVAGLRGERRDVGLWEAGPQDLAWAPDGSRLAYATAAELEPRNAHGQSSGGPAELSPSETRIVLPEGSLVAEIPRGSAAVWSPAGRRLAYIALSRALPGQPRLSLFTAAADGSRPRRLADHGRLAQPQAWSPDGQAIAYVGTEAEQIWLSTGGRPRLLTHLKPGGVIESVWWTPDARRVRFTWEFTAID